MIEFINNLGINSTSGFIGLGLLLLGFFLIFAGFGVISIEKITVKQGKATWIIGIFIALVGGFLFYPELVKPEARPDHADNVEEMQVSTPPSTPDENKGSLEWRPIQFTIPGDNLWREEDGVYTAVGSKDTIAWSEKKYLGDINSGITVNVESDKDEISIKSTKFETTDNYENVNYTIKKLDDKPADIYEEPMENSTVYEYLDIKLTTNKIDMHEEEFEYIKFQFKVDKTWIENNNIDQESITLVRFNKGWHPLPTSFLFEDELFLYFEAESPGLSIYTVVGTEIIEGSNDLIIDRPTISIYGWFAIITFISIILVTIVLKLKFIYKDD